MWKYLNKHCFIILLVCYSCFSLALIGCHPSHNHKAFQPVLLEIPMENDCGELVSHFAYTLSYNANTLVANWVAYELTAEEIDGPWTRKGLRFIPDPDCISGQADNEDYRNSGYSRGHLAPAGDMKWDSLAMIECFYYTNCIPQDKELNNGKWNQLEMKVRSLAREYGRVYVVCGPAFLKEDTLRIGHNGVAVPDACFKALLVPTDKGHSAIAFLMRNGGESRSVRECALTVDELEAIVGIDLFCNLPDNEENSVESKVIWDVWGLK